MSSRHKINIQSKEEKMPIYERIIDLFSLAVLCILPLFFTDKYFNILQSKYYFYIGCVILLIVLLIIIACIEHKRVKSYWLNFSLKRFIERLTITDVSLLIFLMAALISTVNSLYVSESFWGNEGRYSGLFLLILYGIAYFAVSRLGKTKTWYFDAFLLAHILVCLLGIADYFKLDLLNFKVDMYEAQRSIFTSTIGNINTYTALIGMVSAVSAVLFATANKQSKRIFYYISMVISFFALIMGVSDNAYLSLAALFGLLPLYLFSTRKGVKAYFVIIASFFTVVQCVDWINIGMADKVLGIDSAFNLIINFSGLSTVVLILWGLTAVFYVFTKEKMNNDFSHNWLRTMWLIIIIFFILIAVYICLDVNVFGNADHYGTMKNYLLFDDDWGTHRGYIWRNAMECFNAFPLMKKVFGFGPDTFGIVLLNKTFGNAYGEIFDSAHNEYLHYLITVGIAGLGSYLLFVGSYLIRIIRKVNNNPYAMASAFAVICYGTQATVNLNLPIAAPIMWMFIMLGESYIRNEAKETRVRK